MKRLLLVIITMLGVSRGVFADSLIEKAYGGFVGNAKFAIESTTEGTSKPMFLDNFLEVGSLNKGPILGLDFAVGGTILPNSAQFRSAEWSSGVKIHLAPFIKNYVKLPPEWLFLDNMEIDVRASYDWTIKHPFYGLVALYPFK